MTCPGPLEGATRRDLRPQTRPQGCQELWVNRSSEPDIRATGGYAGTPLYVGGEGGPAWESELREAGKMIFIGTPSGPGIRAAMSRGEMGCMTTPAQGNRVPDGALWAGDNGKFGKGWPGLDRWWAWAQRQVSRYGTERCLWILAPDVPFDAAATLAESRPWLARIRSLGVPAAFAAQDGCERGLIPWGEFDVIFIAGSTDWKLGSVAHAVCQEARERGVGVHMGRVNTRRRLRIAEWFGCDSCDGTTFARGGDGNWRQLERWTDALYRQPSLGSP